jgi:hypothetical protein
MASCQACYCTNEKRKCEKIIFFVITGQDYPCQHIDQWPRRTRESTIALATKKKINIRHYFTIYIIFNDKIAPDQCWYIIPCRLHDVTGRINPRMDYAFCLLHIEEFWKMAIPIFGATGNINQQILPYGILFLIFVSTNVFYLLSFKFSR